MNSPILSDQSAPSQPSPASGVTQAAAAPEAQRDTPPPPGVGTRHRVIARRYRVDELLAEGGMAVVYRGWHVPLDEPIAIKILKREYAENEEAVTRFLQEARAGALLRGKNVAHVLDIGRLESGLPFMVTELLQGRDLQQLIEDRGHLPVETSIRLLSEICAAVAEVHRSGIVHRDLKPANIFVARDGEGQPLIKLLDFGIAKRLDGRDLNDTKNSLGSPHYMAPEQIVSPEAVDVQADIWSLGIVLFELLTGRVPFDASTVPAVCGQALHAPCPAPSAFSPDVPPALDGVVLRCLEKEPGERYASALELRDALLACAPTATPAPARDDDELDVPVTIAPLQDPMLSEAKESTPVAALQRRRGTRVVAIVMAASAGILALSFSPTRDAVERAYGATEYVAERTYSQAAKALAPRWERWFANPASQQSASARALAPVSASAPAPADHPTAPVVVPVPPEAEAAHPAPSPPKPRLAPNKAASAQQLTPAPTRHPDLIETRYALTPNRSKPSNHDLIDPYPDLR